MVVSPNMSLSWVSKIQLLPSPQCPWGLSQLFSHFVVLWKIRGIDWGDGKSYHRDVAVGFSIQQAKPTNMKQCPLKFIHVITSARHLTHPTLSILYCPVVRRKTEENCPCYKIDCNAKSFYPDSWMVGLIESSYRVMGWGMGPGIAFKLDR